MKRNWILALVFALTLAVSVSAFAAAAAQKGGSQTECPVMAGKIDKKLYADYQGKRVYFCCSGCLDEFKKDPEKYMKKLEAQGVAVEKAP